MSKSKHSEAQIIGALKLVEAGRAFAKIIQHHNASHTSQSAKRLLVQLSPDTRAGAEHQ